MIRKLELNDRLSIQEYVRLYEDQTFYFKKLLETFKGDDTVYGYFEEGTLQGLFSFTHTNAMIIHVKSEKVFRTLDLLKLIKAYKPRFIKGEHKSVQGVYKIIYRTLRSEEITKVLLMRFDGTQAIDSEYDVVKSISEVKMAIQQDVQFLLSINKHFGRKNAPVRDIENTVIKEFELGERDFFIASNRFIAHGLIEESGTDYAVVGGIYVSPKLRGMGYGKAMSIHLTNRILALGKTPYLFVKQDNAIAQGIYTAIGYKPVYDYTILEVEF